ncbi:DUF6380 family protein [Streptomyces sp. NPDC001443]
MDGVGEGDSAAEMRHATLRPGTASLTATACRARFQRCDRAAGEGAR